MPDEVPDTLTKYATDEEMAEVVNKVGEHETQLAQVHAELAAMRRERETLLRPPAERVAPLTAREVIVQAQRTAVASVREYLLLRGDIIDTTDISISIYTDGIECTMRFHYDLRKDPE